MVPQNRKVIDRKVIDYKKQNEKTIPDRYPMQDSSVILSSLGKASTQ